MGGTLSCRSRVALSISRVSGKVVVVLDGVVDAETTGCLRPLIVDLVEGQGNLHVEIDLERASVDGTGVGLLAETSHESCRRGGVLIVRGAPSAVREALVGLDVTVADDGTPERDALAIGGSTSR